MNVNIEDFSKIVIAWIDGVLVPKLESSTMPAILKNSFKTLLTAFLSYNMVYLDEQIKKGLTLFTLNSTFVNLDNLERALNACLEANNGKVCLNTLIPKIAECSLIPPYDADKDDVKSFIEIAKGFAK